MENTGFYVIPNKTQYEIGERVWLEIKKTGPTKANHVKVSLFTYQGENLKMECTLEQGVYIPLAESISEKTGGYLVKIEFFQKTEKLGSCYTAFDVVNCWTEAPRYGFLSSFSEEDKQKEEYQEFFREMHLNVIQFYDWMYRHDEFYPESDGKKRFDDCCCEKNRRSARLRCQGNSIWRCLRCRIISGRTSGMQLSVR